MDNQHTILCGGQTPTKDNDASVLYASDVFTGIRPKEEDRMMVALYLERAKRVAKIKTTSELIGAFPEIVRSLKYFRESPQAAAEKIVALHNRHGKEVKSVLADMVGRHKEAIADHSLPSDCLLKIAYDSGSCETTPAAAPQKFHKQQEERWEDEKQKANVYKLGRGHKVWNLVFRGERDSLKEERAVELPVRSIAGYCRCLRRGGAARR